ncbi:site-2 protease family protein [Methanococcoides seepicolus]|uniref:Site-2 protease family protein n=1 Tax=Methanococcoides seepicolus TaxID=2828780 RepID=A0A9E4ZG43_9EURY|nr:site-2 protease family protein [Methanococcoides seepicolus]MCM1986534.1 site-2 protease family protein [Methanococcoides seepicolus]
MSSRTKAPEDAEIEAMIMGLYDDIHPFFKAYEVGYADSAIHFYGVPQIDPKMVHQYLWPKLTAKGYQLSFTKELGEDVLVVSPIQEVPERIWINVLLAVATVFTTMFAGATMFGVDIFSEPSQFTKGLPFTLAIMFVLGSHEMGHYMAAKMHGMRTSLPYFIPFPTIIGTMGAVIKHRGIIPDRKALFDVAVAGPLVGIVASVIVTFIGLSLPPVEYIITPGNMVLDIQVPLLFQAINTISGNTVDTMHPVAFAGWVGMLVTVLNLLPSGQLDGGHIVRAMLGERAKHVSMAMPFILGCLGLYVIFVLQQNGGIWMFWSIFLLLFALAGHPRTLNDDIKLDNRRMALGIGTFILGLLCFTLVPFTLVIT